MALLLNIAKRLALEAREVKLKQRSGGHYSKDTKRLLTTAKKGSRQRIFRVL